MRPNSFIDKDYLTTLFGLLGREELDFMGIDPETRNRFLALSRLERHLISALGDVFAKYQSDGVLQEGAQLETLINRFANRELDGRWLIPASRRAVEIKAAATVWQRHSN